MPRLLSEEHKKNRMGAALSFLLAYERKGISLTERIITGDEM